jgi:hypothetical protein
MVNIKDIEKSISNLPPKKLAEFRRWFAKFDPAYRLGLEILEAEEQIKRKEIVSWSQVKRKHGL